jgi:hypothetical protein
MRLLLSYAGSRHNPLSPTTCFSVACLILMFGAWLRRVPRPVPLLAMVSVAFLTASCGGGSSTLPPPQVITGTPSGSFTLVLHATSGGQEHAVNLTLNVT